MRCPRSPQRKVQHLCPPEMHDYVCLHAQHAHVCGMSQRNRTNRTRHNCKPISHQGVPPGLSRSASRCLYCQTQCAVGNYHLADVLQSDSFYFVGNELVMHNKVAHCVHGALSRADDADVCTSTSRLSMHTMLPSKLMTKNNLFPALTHVTLSYLLLYIYSTHRSGGPPLFAVFI